MEKNRILIVDDDPALCLMLGDFFIRHSDYDCVAAALGKEAIAILGRQEFDLAIVDLLMPEIDGMGLLSHILAHYPRTDVIIMTGKDGKSCYTEVIKAGAVDFIEKPFEYDELSAKINRVFRERELVGNLRDEIRQRQVAEEEIGRHLQTQVILNKLLHLVLESTSLTSILERFIEYITSLPMLALVHKGAIFLIDSDGKTLKLAAHRRLPLELQRKCDRVDFGHCLCGRAAASGEIVFANDLDDRHDNSYQGISPHGHYCIPIKSGNNRLLGVFTVYIAAGLRRDAHTEDILQAAASVAAVVIERKKTEEETEKLQGQLRRAQKLESIGTLAGGIAHDFNNILSAILGFASLAMDAVPAETQVRSDIDQIVQAGRRAKKLVQQILTFSRQMEQERTPVQIIYLVKETIKLLRASLPSTIEIRQMIDPGCGVVLADSTQIHQILMNLCTNSFHAMREKGGGVLSVELKNVTVDEEMAETIPELHGGAYVRMTVTDTGSGIDPLVIERIFEPYFTTKNIGEGTGLGLSVVHGIVKSHGGVITVSSKFGEGASFQVYLPNFHENLVEHAEVATPLPVGTEHILLVDDEEPIVVMGKQMLENLGYTVTGRTSSVEALTVFQAYPERFDLVLTDQTMPNMTGIDLARQVRIIRPELPILLTTGFSETIWTDDLKKLGICELLMKPVEMRQLAEAIRRSLDNRKPESGQNSEG